MHWHFKRVLVNSWCSVSKEMTFAFFFFFFLHFYFGMSGDQYEQAENLVLQKSALKAISSRVSDVVDGRYKLGPTKL